MLELSRQVDAYELRRTIEQLIPVIAPTDGPEVVEHLAARLSDLVESDLPETLRGGDRDFSSMWRSDIPTVQPGHEYEAKSILVDGILSAATAFVGAGGKIDSILEPLSRRRRSVFRRLELHLVRVYGAADLKIRWMLRKDLFELAGARGEYRGLLGDACDKLPTDDLRTIRAWVDAGDEQRFVNSYRKTMDAAPNDDEVNRHRDLWRLAWLSSIMKCLDADGRDELTRLEGIYVAAPERELQTRLAGLDPQAAADPEAFAGLSGSELLQYVAKASSTGFGAIDAISRELTRIAQSTPEVFENPTANYLEELDPTFAHAIALGLRQAVEQERNTPWPFVLLLTQHIASDPKIPSRKGDPFDYQPDWTSARIEAAALLSAYLSRKLPLAEAADAIWELISTLSKDRSPTAEYENAYGPPNMGPSVLALNTVRPAAIVAAINFASWRKQRPDETMDGRTAELLSEHLKDDPSIAVRAAFGGHFVALLMLDESWTERNLGTMLGEDIRQDPLGRVGWEAFLFHTRPHARLFALLKSYYRQAVDQLNGDDDEGSPSSRLVDHLATYYIMGLIDLEADGLIASIWRRATDKDRVRFISTLGEILRANPGMSAEMSTRLMTFWDWVEAQTIGDRAADLAEFGWWFGSDRLDDEWSLRRLVAALSASPQVRNEVQVAQRLDRLTPAFPELALDALRRMALDDSRGWVVYSIEPVIRSAVAKARRAGGDAAAKADELVSRLLAAGLVQYGDLAVRN